MTVYIDQIELPYGRMKMSHMIADDLEELHNFAKQIGLKREWFQDRSIPHYDISKGKKQLALKMGAVEVPSKELLRIARLSMFKWELQKSKQGLTRP